MRTASEINRDHVRRVTQREEGRFEERHPKSIALLRRARACMPNGVPMGWMTSVYHHPPLWVVEGKGACFTDVDGHTYVDFNIADMSTFCGYAPSPVAEAVATQVGRGSQFLLPSEDAIWVAQELTRRWGVAKWQFTLSASLANLELIRIARAATGRDKVLFFDGKYHGHFDETLIELKNGELRTEEAGLPDDVASHTKVVQFNDAEAVQAALEPGDVAVGVAEPAMTNNYGL